MLSEAKVNLVFCSKMFLSRKHRHNQDVVLILK